MSRYLELSVDGTMERVGERALRAFRRIGKVKEQDLSAGKIAGIIRIDGEPADVRISWRPGREGRVRMDIAASSDDTLSQAADSALYTYASTYKSVGWPNPERDRQEQTQKQLKLAVGTVAVILAGVLAYILLKTSAYQSIR
jgi:hypothetical protein